MAVRERDRMNSAWRLGSSSSALARSNQNAARWMSIAAYSGATPVPTLAGSIRVGSNETVARLLAAATAAFDSDRDAARACIARAAALLQVSPHQQQLKTVHLQAALGGLAPWQAKRVSAYIEANLGSRIRA